MTTSPSFHAKPRALPILAATAATLTVTCLMGLQSATAAASIWPVACTNNSASDTPALQTAVRNAEAHGGAVSIAAGTCALSDHVVVNSAVVITGAGASATFVVQHAYRDIFEISGDDVTVQNVNLDTATYNASAPNPLNPNPPVLYSTANNTTVSNVAGEAGSGFGMRITGPNPCYAHLTGGAAVSNVTMTTTGTGGYAGVDVDCQSHASLSNITIHGGYLAIYRDSNVTLTTEQFTPGPNAEKCAPPWFVTSDSIIPSAGIGISHVTSAGGEGVVHGTVLGLVVTAQTLLNRSC